MTWENFNLDEFACRHCGKNLISHNLVDKLQSLRTELGFPFVITSGYGSPSHPIEARKEIPGTHAQGIAADIKATNSAQRYTLIRTALEHGFTGIGVASDFIHVDTRGTVPVMWLY